jgi:recombination protein RecA
VGEIFNLAVAMGIIKKSGSWFSYNESKLGQGAEVAKTIVRDNPELLEELAAIVTEKLAEKKD